MLEVPGVTDVGADGPRRRRQGAARRGRDHGRRGRGRRARRRSRRRFASSSMRCSSRGSSRSFRGSRAPNAASSTRRAARAARRRNRGDDRSRFRCVASAPSHYVAEIPQNLVFFHGHFDDVHDPARRRARRARDLADRQSRAPRGACAARHSPPAVSPAGDAGSTARRHARSQQRPPDVHGHLRGDARSRVAVLWWNECGCARSSRPTTIRRRSARSSRACASTSHDVVVVDDGSAEPGAQGARSSSRATGRVSGRVARRERRQGRGGQDRPRVGARSRVRLRAADRCRSPTRSVEDSRARRERHGAAPTRSCSRSRCSMRPRRRAGCARARSPCSSRWSRRSAARSAIRCAAFACIRSRPRCA